MGHPLHAHATWRGAWPHATCGQPGRRHCPAVPGHGCRLGSATAPPTFLSAPVTLPPGLCRCSSACPYQCLHLCTRPGACRAPPASPHAAHTRPEHATHHHLLQTPAVATPATNAAAPPSAATMATAWWVATDGACQQPFESSAEVTHRSSAWAAALPPNGASRPRHAAHAPPLHRRTRTRPATVPANAALGYAFLTRSPAAMWRIVSTMGRTNATVLGTGL